MAGRTSGYELRTFLIGMVAFSVIMVGILAMVPGSANLAALGQVRLRAPDFGPLWETPLVVQVHVLTVFYALLVGPIQFALPKGATGHRLIGWTWVAAMFATAVSSLFIREIDPAGGFSPIHIFSAFAFVSLPLGVWLARRGDIRGHRGTMVGLYIGLVIAGVLAVAPGRIIWDMFFA